MSYSKVINYIAGSAFSVYLISENKNISPKIWTSMNFVSYLQDETLILRIILAAVIVFAISILIDVIRRIAISNIRKILKYIKLRIIDNEEQ